jgi:uroporphyrinogen-III synthase
LNADAPITLNALKVDWTPAVFYKTVMSDLSDLADVYYDVLALVQLNKIVVYEFSRL